MPRSDTSDDLEIGYDNNSDGDIADAGDDMQIEDDFNSNQTSLTYDNAGNLTDDGVYKYVYDAWNRLVEVTRRPDDTTTVAAYAYDGKNRRTKKVVSNSGIEETSGDGGGHDGALSTTRNRWQILETRNGSDQATRQWVYGTQYVDEPLLMDVNLEPGTDNDCDPDNETGSESSSGTNDRRYVYHQDRNWNVVALTETADGEGGTAGAIAERYAYTPYGEFVVLAGGSAGTGGNAQLTSSVGNPFAHQGLPLDAEKLSYQNRWREHAAGLQRFAQRDPAISGVRAIVGESDAATLYTPGTRLVPPIRTSGLSGRTTCEVELVCWETPFQGAGIWHCEPRVTFSLGSGWEDSEGRCNCGPRFCRNPACFCACLRCDWRTSSPPSGSQTFGSHWVSEDACDCLRERCDRASSHDGCYRAVTGDNSNTASSCLNSTCNLGFSDPPVFAPGWDKPCPPGF